MHSWRRRESAGELSSDESPRVGALRQRPSVLPALETPSSKKGVGRLGGQTDRQNRRARRKRGERGSERASEEWRGSITLLIEGRLFSPTATATVGGILKMSGSDRQDVRLTVSQGDVISTLFYIRSSMKHEICVRSNLQLE